MKHLFAMAFAFLLTAASHADVTFTTHDSKGSPIATFALIQGPSGFSQRPVWRDQSGMLWSWDIGEFSNEALAPDEGGTIINSPAVSVCRAIGGVLPTRADYQRLMSYFEIGQHGNLSKKGLEDLSVVFSDMYGLGDVFWTTTVALSLPGVATAYMFDERYGYIDDGKRSGTGHVRCTVH